MTSQSAPPDTRLVPLAVASLVLAAAHHAMGAPTAHLVGGAARVGTWLTSALALAAVVAWWSWRRAERGSGSAVYAVPRGVRGAVVVGTIGSGVAVISTFPGTYNHLYFELLILAVFAVYLADREGRAMGIRVVQAVAVSGLVWTGVQKLWYGGWWDGAYLAYLTGTEDRFAESIGRVLRGDVLAELRLVAAFEPSGPFRVESPGFVWLARAVPLAELGTGIALCVPRARPYAVPAALLVLVGIELVAREVVYGMFFATSVLAFAPRGWCVVWARLAPVLGLAAVAARLLAPDWGVN